MKKLLAALVMFGVIIGLAGCPGTTSKKTEATTPKDDTKKKDAAS